MTELEIISTNAKTFMEGFGVSAHEAFENLKILAFGIKIKTEELMKYFKPGQTEK